MCESKLGKLMQAFRADRPSEWQMDEFIGIAEEMHKRMCDMKKFIESCSEYKGDGSASHATYMEIVKDIGEAATELLKK